MHQLENIEDEQYRDSTTLFQLLKETIDGDEGEEWV